MTNQTAATPNVPSWDVLLKDAIETPGRILEAYTAFHEYSMGNCLLAIFQCCQRGIKLGPISTYKGWQSKGRQVRKGEKAIVLCMPITCARQSEGDTASASNSEADQQTARFTRFIFRPNWFVMSQTDGPDQSTMFTVEAAASAFNFSAMLTKLEIASVPFDHLDGNAQGYARGRTIAISPLAQLPEKTTFHECAHILLGHTAEGTEMSDGEHTPRSLREVEAEAVALICCESLGIKGADYARGYIQSWMRGTALSVIPEASARKIFKAADAILKSGTPEAA